LCLNKKKKREKVSEMKSCEELWKEKVRKKKRKKREMKSKKEEKENIFV
jgi:hypothetical protein